MVTPNHQLIHVTAAFRSCIRKFYPLGFNLEDPIDGGNATVVCLSQLSITYFKILALCLPPNVWVSSHAPMRRQAPNIWVSQHLFGHPGLGQDLRACVGKVLRTFAHIASLCYASYIGKILCEDLSST